MTTNDDFLQSVANMEQALADIIATVSENATPEELNRILKLIVKKEVILELLLEEAIGSIEECRCKFRLGIAGNAADASVIVVNNGVQETFSGTINFSAEQCFTGGPNCNPAVNNFAITFGDNENTINLTQGRRGIISCEDGLTATLQNGTAQASGNVLEGEFTVNFSYGINPVTNLATIEILATADNGDKFQTTFTSPISPQTFIGNCEETVAP